MTINTKKKMKGCDFWNKKYGAWVQNSWNKKRIEEAAVKLYGEGAKVFIPDDYCPSTYEKVPVLCPKHNTISWNYRRMDSVSCVGCKKDKGLIARTKEEWQDVCDEKHGKGEYDLYLWGRDTHTGVSIFPIWHRNCGTHFDSSLTNIVTTGGRCPYCTSGRPASQEQLEHKAKDLEYPRHLEFKYHRVPLKQGGASYEIEMKCSKCGKEDSPPTTRFVKGEAGCPCCQPTRTYKEHTGEWSKQEKEMSPLHDIDHWLVFHEGYLPSKPTGYCSVHNHTFQSTKGCYICAGDMVRDEVSMREALYRNAAPGLDFSKSTFVKKEEDVGFICPIHGEQKLMRHRLMKGADCPVCAAENNGWGRKGFYSSSQPSHLYLVRIKHGGDYGEREFLKVGLARHLDKRFQRTQQEARDNWKSYYLEVEYLNVWKGAANKLWEIESHLKWRSGIPNLDVDMPFHGFTECFDMEYREALIEDIGVRVYDEIKEVEMGSKILRWEFDNKPR